MLTYHSKVRACYLIYRPQVYLFNGHKVGKAMSLRSVQHLVKKAMIQMGLDSNRYSDIPFEIVLLPIWSIIVLIFIQ